MSGPRGVYIMRETVEDAPGASPAVGTTSDMSADAIEETLLLASLRWTAARSAFDAAALAARHTLAEARRACASASALLAELRRGR